MNAIPDLTALDVADFEAPLAGLIHSLHRDTLRDRVERLRFSRKAAAAKHSRNQKPVSAAEVEIEVE